MTSNQNRSISVGELTEGKNNKRTTFYDNKLI